MKDGSLAKQPIALVEVQGYVYLAKTRIAALFDRAGEHARAEALRREAEALQDRFARSYWLADEGLLALALTPDGPAAVLSSNPGQALWTGIVRPDHARATVQRLLSPPMWSGWGIRTLSEDARRYNPIAYHRGTVWPHDNAIIAAGFRRYGFDDAACQVFNGLFEASTHFPLHRLPELMSGFRRDDYGTPIRYPVACHPQAWAAGSIPFLLTSLLGLASDGFDRRLRVVRPVLPEGIGEVEFHGLRVGTGSVDLAFGRQQDGELRGAGARRARRRGGARGPRRGRVTRGPPRGRVWVGPSGYSYPDWRGSFYPHDLPASRFLEYAAGRFDSMSSSTTPSTTSRPPAPSTPGRPPRRAPRSCTR